MTDQKMEYVNLGNSGLKVSKIILGAMSYGSSAWQDWVLNEEQALPLLKHAYDRGINTWDTADIYSHGASERIIGKALTKYSIPRSRVVILSKCYFGVREDDPTMPPIAECMTNDGDTVNQVGLSRKHIFDAVEKSVERLGTYIDVLQIHRLDRGTPREEIMRALNDVVEKGWVRYLGASSMAAWEFQMLQNIADKHGWHKFISMQNYYNLLYREEEREMIPYCNATSVTLTPWSPIARGALTRPLTAHSTTLRSKTDRTLATSILNADNPAAAADAEIIARVDKVATKMGVSMAGVATAWCVGKGVVPIIGLGSRERIDEAVRNATLRLEEGDVRFLEEPYRPRQKWGY